MSKPKVMTTAAILSRLSNYAASAAERGVSAREDILALANGVPAAEFEIAVTAKISAMRLGRVLPAADRIAIVKAWTAKDRVGGKISGKVIAPTLGVVESTISLDKRDGEETTTSTKSDVQKLTSLLKSLQKITGEMDSPSSDAIVILDQIANEASKITKA